jgi:peptide/nickel transport system ATP-binding protein
MASTARFREDGVTTPLLSVRDLRKDFRLRGRLFSPRATVRAVDGVSFDIARGETLALVGESGSGKTTVGRCVLRLTDPDGGQIVLNGQRIDSLPARAIRPLRRHMQVVFQDPFSSLNPRMTVRDLVAEPIRNFGLARDQGEIDARVGRLLAQVALPADAVGRRPHEFSGGQRQRIAIARALAPQPELIVCDEAVSALDSSIKGQIIDLLKDLQQEFGLALLFISHDLPVVARIAHRVAVMHQGRIVEHGPAREVLTSPRAPYTQSLLDAVLTPPPFSP